jgi:hypothetical protein
VALNGFESRGIGGVRLTNHIFPNTLDSRATFSTIGSSTEPLFFTLHSTNEPLFSAHYSASALKGSLIGPESTQLRSLEDRPGREQESRSKVARLMSHFSSPISLDERAIFLMYSSIDEPHSFDRWTTKSSGTKDERATFSRLLSHKNLRNLPMSKSIQQYKLKTLCSYKKNKTPHVCFLSEGITQ